MKRPANYKHPIASFQDAENKGRFIRISRLWELASTQAGLFEKYFSDKLKPLLELHDVPKDIINDVLERIRGMEPLLKALQNCPPPGGPLHVRQAP
ncbi:hypothetical protein QEG98_29810 [Myxococcus sp. MxC21-1]|uniref:hypothetical protein n=1 Tax=Myxococcus sp. MxC21-1 TaxID=3041439 RepID=UPI00292DB53A|nr:hypothetical protein [Myxococcus sp. MxC21-1]WNZ60176.1 hypothetical protein QEG98_29810 [Myxococcus sp. MxC21-1]